jgi:hypothetical protein
MRISRSLSILFRETGAYAAIIAFCVGVVLWAPHFREREDTRYQPIRTEESERTETARVDLPINERGDTALHLAVREGNTGKIVDLLAQNADANLENEDGLSALDLAHARGQEDVIGLLTSQTFRDRIPAEEEPDGAERNK